MHLVRLISSLTIGMSLGCFVTMPAQAQSVLFDTFGLNNTYDRGTTGRVMRAHVFSRTDALAHKTASAFAPSGSDCAVQTIAATVGLFDNSPAAFPEVEDTFAEWSGVRDGKRGAVATDNLSTGNIWFSQIKHALGMRVTRMPVSAAVPDPTAFIVEWSCLLGLVALRCRP